MGDTLADALVLFTKLNTNLVKRVESLESGRDGKKKPTETVEEPDPINIEGFSKKALMDLSQILGAATVDRTKEEKKPAKGKSLLDDILAMLGIAGTGLLALKDKIQKWLTEKLGGIVDDVVKMFKTAIERAKTLLDDAWKGIKNFFKRTGKAIERGATRIGDFLKNVFDDIKNSKFGQSIDKFFKATKNIFKNITSKIGTFFDDIVKWGVQKIDDLKALGKTAIEKLTSAAKKIIPGVAGMATSVATTAKEGAKKAVGYVGAKASAAGEMVVSAGKTVAGKAGQVYEGAKSAGRAVLTKAQAMKEIVSKLAGVKLTASLLGKALRKVPYLGGLIEGYFAEKDINELIEKHIQNPEKYTLQMLHKDIGSRVSEGLGGIVGGLSGAALGGFVGSVIPVAGNLIGAIAGGILGDIGGRWLGRQLGARMDGTEQEIGEYLQKKFKPDLNKNGKKDTPVEKIEDGIITKTGELIRTHTDDTLYAMKNGGPFEKFFNKNNELLEKQGKATIDVMNKQIRILSDSNKLLTEMLEKLKQPTVNTAANVVHNNFSSPVSLRGLQGA